METKPVLEIRNIDKQFPGVHALKNVSLELIHGEVHAVCGENGAGKSTLMKVITGVYIPDDGDIYLNGERIDLHNPNDAYKKGIAIIFQESSLFPDLTVLENIFINHEIQKPLIPGFPGIKINDFVAMRKAAETIFERLGMSIDLNAKISDLGVATKQMVEIAKALSFDSNILILDEPTAALTSREVDTLFSTIQRLKIHGVSMLYISHRLEEIFQIADRVTVLRDGEYIATDYVGNVDKSRLVSWMVGRTLDNLYPKSDVPVGEVVLEVKDLWQDDTLHGITFNLRRGEILGISGLAGAGRTELALAVCGLTRPDDGEIVLHGESLVIRDYRDALEKGIAYISEDRQKYGLVLPMTLKENITHKVLAKISSFLGIIDRKKERDISESYMQRLSIKAPDGDFIVNNLSGGNQQKVSVAKALAVEPEILILDEPTRGVDVGAKSEIHRIISALAAGGKSIIIISSDLPEILGMSDRVLVMKDGCKAGELSRAELTQEKVLEMAL